MGKSRISTNTKNKNTNKRIKTTDNKNNEKAITLKQIEKTEKSQSYPGDSILTSNPSSNGLIPDWNMKLVSWNVNGLRSCIKSKGLEYIREENADIFALQEIKCAKSDIPEEAKQLSEYRSFWCSAEKPGYSGTGVYSRTSPIKISYGIGKKEHDTEGRIITTEYENFYFITAYVPNSGRGLVKLDYRKNSWDLDFTNYLKELDKIKPIIVTGDLNVSHNEIDLSNPTSNKKNAGFTKEERDGFTNLLKSVDLIDTFRHIYPVRTGGYTYWSNMRNARDRNIGWRLDYFLISRRLLPNLCNQELRTKVMGSDHCPIVLYLKF